MSTVPSLQDDAVGDTADPSTPVNVPVAFEDEATCGQTRSNSSHGLRSV